MTKIQPYLKIGEAISSLDNGGRFYNILTKADDGIISKSELAKVGGVFNDKQKMILFFEMSISKLDKNQQTQIISKLEPKLKDAYLKFKPTHLSPIEVISKGTLASNIIVTGTPKLVDTKSDFTGFIFMPINTSDINSFILIPLSELYYVYEIRDQENDEKFFIAHSKSSSKLEEKKMKLGGTLKEFKSEKKEDSISNKFLEISYHMDL